MYFDTSYVVYYESIKRESKIRGIYECRCDERLQTKSKEFTLLVYTGFCIFVYYESMKRKLILKLYMNVGVMKDYKLRDLRAPHTLGWSGLVLEHTSVRNGFVFSSCSLFSAV